MSAPEPLDGVKLLADRYADELTAQFRTLSLFVQHAGEIGRAHEVFLRGVLARFLPERLRCGSGFVASARGVSRQQDIVIYDPYVLPVLFEVGDCLVADAEAVAGTIEVKTALGSKPELLEALSKLRALKREMHGFVGLYAWEGLSLDAALDCYWQCYREMDDLSSSVMPDALYVRGQYLISPNYDGRLDSAPLLVLRIGPAQESEGAALLSLVERMWISGLQQHARWPWWVTEWRARLRDRHEHQPWPEDLRARVERQLAAVRGNV